MKKNKLGFTLAEVLICMVILGVIMAISVGTLKIIRASYSSLAYFEYKNIQRFAGEMIAGRTMQVLKNNAGVSITPTIMKQTKLGHYITLITDINADFCQQITGLSNTVGDASCSNLPEVVMKSWNGNSEPTLIIDEKTTPNLYNNPTFISNSGRRYYISKRVISRNDDKNNDPDTTIDYNDDRIVSDEYGYRIIAVDLNGTQAPNTSIYNGRKVPDIVNFMILDNGEVFPLGPAADNIKMGDGRVVLYLNSKIKGYYFKYDETRKDTVPKDCATDAKSGVDRCNFGVVYAPNENSPGPGGKQNFFFSYREAYCSSLGERGTQFTAYCDGIKRQELCPPSSSDKKFDLCRVDNIKPVFRYNF